MLNSRAVDAFQNCDSGALPGWIHTFTEVAKYGTRGICRGSQLPLPPSLHDSLRTAQRARETTAACPRILEWSSSDVPRVPQ